MTVRMTLPFYDVTIPPVPGFVSRIQWRRYLSCYQTLEGGFSLGGPRIFKVPIWGQDSTSGTLPGEFLVTWIVRCNLDLVFWNCLFVNTPTVEVLGLKWKDTSVSRTVTKVRQNDYRYVQRLRIGGLVEKDLVSFKVSEYAGETETLRC